MRLPYLLTPYALKHANPAHKTVSLENIRVAAPCPARWDEMNGDSRVRNCAECKLSVYNLSDMTRSEAEQLIASHEGRLCVRFYRRTDGTIITRDCPKKLRAVTERVSRLAGAVLTAMMAVASAAVAQSQPSPGSSGQVESKNEQLGLDVTVVDPTNALIPNAKVTLCRCKGKVANDVTTDAAGAACFRNLPKGTYEISVQAPGFRENRRNITIKKIEQLQVKLQIAVQTTTIEVKAKPVEIMGTMGMVTTIQDPGLLMMPASGSGRPALMR